MTGPAAARYRANGAAVYGAMADGAREPALRALYGKLAEAERRHAELWREQLRAAGATRLPEPPSSPRAGGG